MITATAFLAGWALALAASLQSETSKSTSAFWTIVDRPKLERMGGLCDPKVLTLQDGTLVASVGRQNRGGVEGTNVYRSTDAGRSWQVVRNGVRLERASLFRQGSKVVLVGIRTGLPGFGGDVLASRSDDGGATWSEVRSATQGRLGERPHLVPSGAGLLEGDRVWVPFKQLRAADGGDWAQLVVASVPVNADSLDPMQWTWSEPWIPPERNALAFDLWSLLPGPSSTPIVRMRGKDGSSQSVADLSTDGLHVEPRDQVPQWTDPTDASGWARPRDPVSGRTLVVTIRGRTREDETSSVVELRSSADLRDWRFDSTLFRDPRSDGFTFAFADWCVAGDDLIAILSGAGPVVGDPTGTPSFLERNALVFLRVPRFRTRTPNDPSLWEASSRVPTTLGSGK